MHDFVVTYIFLCTCWSSGPPGPSFWARSLRKRMLGGHPLLFKVYNIYIHIHTCFIGTVIMLIITRIVMILTINSDSNTYIYTYTIHRLKPSIFVHNTEVCTRWLGFRCSALCLGRWGCYDWRCSSTTKCWTRNHRVIAVISIYIPTYGGFQR